MRQATNQSYGSPISLRDVVDMLGSDRLRHIIGELSGAIVLTPKGNERWRYALDTCMVLGHISSAIVTGKRIREVRAVEALIRQAAQEAMEGPIRVRIAVRAARTFVTHALAASSSAETTQAAITLLVGCWQELNAHEQAQAYSHLERLLPNPQRQLSATQIVRAVMTVYAHEGTDAPTWETPSTTVIPAVSDRVSLLPLPMRSTSVRSA